MGFANQFAILVILLSALVVSTAVIAAPPPPPLVRLAAPTPSTLSSGQHHYGDGGPLADRAVELPLDAAPGQSFANCAAWAAAQRELAGQPVGSAGKWNCQDMDGDGVFLIWEVD